MAIIAVKCPACSGELQLDDSHGKRLLHVLWNKSYCTEFN